MSTSNEKYKHDLAELVKSREKAKHKYDEALAQIMADRQEEWDYLVEQALDRVTLLTFDELYFKVKQPNHVKYLEAIQLDVAETMAEHYRNEGEWE